MAQILLCEETPDEQTLKDLSCEIANLVVGSAKVIAANANRHFDITTPKSLSLEAFCADNYASFACNQSGLTLGFKQS